MVKTTTILECLLGIILVFSLVLFVGAISAYRSTIDAIPVSTNDVQVDLSSDVTEPEPEPAQTTFSEPEPEPESMTFISSYTPPVYNRRGGRNKVDSNVQATIEDEGVARVIVTLSDSRRKDDVLNALDSFDLAVDMKYGFAGYVEEDDLEKLESHEDVLGIDEDRILHAANAQSFPQINADKAVDMSFNGFANLTGKDQTVCIIDTGVDVGHDDLGNCTGTDYVNGNCSKTIGGWNYITSLNDPYDSNGHGTSMAGIITGNGSGYTGLAPEAKIVSLKVTESNLDPTAYESDVANAVDWCVSNKSKFNISVISLGVATSATYSGGCDGFTLTNAIDNAVANNLTVFAASGNSEKTDGISYPACGTNAISVSAVTDGSGTRGIADVIPDNAVEGWGPNRFPSLTDLMAPGNFIYTLDKNDGYMTVAGTSRATAHAVGSAILLKEYAQEKYGKSLTPAEIREAFTTTGKPIWDVNTSASYPRLDLLKAIRSLDFTPELQKGMSYTSWWNNDYTQAISDTSLGLVNDTGANYISLLVTWYQDNLSSTNIYSSGTKTPSDAALIDAINRAHSLGMKVMLKPHVDVNTGQWRGYINSTTEANWNEWFANYTNFMNYYADFAETNGVDMLSVGVELKGTTHRDFEWESVIYSARDRFSGPITYSANFDNYQNITWWDKIDYIGIDAYFKLTALNDPTVQDLKDAWVPHKNNITNFYSTWQKPIVFTEIGYQIWNGSNQEPYKKYTSGTQDLQEQADCYTAAFETFWNETWFYGTYWWEWYYDYTNDIDFYGLYNNPAEAVVRLYYKNETPDNNTYSVSLYCYDTYEVSYGGVENFDCDFTNNGTSDDETYVIEVTNLDSADSVVLSQSIFTGIDSGIDDFFEVDIEDYDVGIYDVLVKVYDQDKPSVSENTTITLEVVPKPSVTLNNPANGSTILVDNTVLDFTLGTNVTCKFELDNSAPTTRIDFQGSGDYADLTLNNIDGEEVLIDYYYTGSAIEFGASSDPDDGYIVADGSCQGSSDVRDCEGFRILKVESDGTAHALEIKDIDDNNDEIEIFDDGSGMSYVETYVPEQFTALALGSYTLKLNVSEAGFEISAIEVNEYAPYTFKGEYGSNITLLGSTGINITSPTDSLDFTWYYDSSEIVLTEAEILDDMVTDVYPYYTTGGQSASSEAGFTDYGTYVRYDPNLEDIRIDYPQSQIKEKDVFQGADDSYSLTSLTDGQHNISMLCNYYQYNYVFTVDTSGDVTPPVISNVVNMSITNESVQIEWDTDELSNSSVNYGLVTSLGTTAGSDTDVIAHEVYLLNLQDNTTYYYNVTSCDASDNCATVGPYSFTTDANSPVNVAPTISGIPDQNVDEDTKPSWQIDLWAYSTDDNPLSDSSFTITLETNTSLIDCFIVSSRYVNCSIPSADNYGYSNITVKIEDEELESDTDTFMITVNPINDAPVLDTIANITVNEGDLVQLNPSSSDIDGGVPIYSFEAPLNSTGGWQTSAGDAGLYIVNVSVSDGNGGVDWQLMGIVVSAAPLLADLNITSATVATPSPMVNRLTSLRIIIENTGDIAANNIYWYFDTNSSQNNLGFGPFDLAPGETVHAYPGAFYNVSGTYNPVFTVDINGTIVEYDETNNQVTIPVTVS